MSSLIVTQNGEVRLTVANGHDAHSYDRTGSKRGGSVQSLGSAHGGCREPQLPISSKDAPALAATAAHGGGHAHISAKVYLDPPAIYEHVADIGATKAHNSLLKESVLGMLAGGYIGLGFSLCMLCAGQLSQELRTSQPGLFNFFFGAFGFPFGLSLVVLTGAELFTSNVAYMTAAFLEGRVRIGGLLYIWITSYFANLAGSLLLTQLMVWGKVFVHYEEFVLYLAHKKLSHTFGTAVTRGALCNWLVCLGVWQANGAQDITGKVVGIWLPISAFVAMGFEHCIANQFMIPMSMRLGSGITVNDFVAKNLLPATIGNIIGGALFVVTCYSISFGRLGRRADAASAALSARLRAAFSSKATSSFGGSSGGAPAPERARSASGAARAGSAVNSKAALE